MSRVPLYIIQIRVWRNALISYLTSSRPEILLESKSIPFSVSTISILLWRRAISSQERWLSFVIKVQKVHLECQKC